MGIREKLQGIADILLGVSAYQQGIPGGAGSADIDSPEVKRAREALGGNIQPLPTTRLRWYLKDLESAQEGADAGYLRLASQLYRTMRRDGTMSGLLNTRTAGLVRLPKRFYGNPTVVEQLERKNDSRSVFDEMFPPSELALMAADGIVLGVSVAEMVPVPGRDYPVMVRLEPEFLQYRWNENRWYYNSIVGSLPITPGDGRWILHVPGGRLTPWTSGLWPALGRSFINKEHAILNRANYAAKLANPARAAIAPIGATEAQRVGFFKRILAWGTSTVFELPVGWDVKLIESNGRGWEVFEKEIATSDHEMMVALAGQVVTTDGGAGFANADIHRGIRQDLIQETGEALAYTINTQGIPQYAAMAFGVDVLETPAWVEWDTKTWTDLNQESDVLSKLGPAIQALENALAPFGENIDVRELATRFGVSLGEPGAPRESKFAPPAPEDGADTGDGEGKAAGAGKNGVPNKARSPKSVKSQEKDNN